MTKNKISTDVLVIGGGPAGSTVASLLSKEGINVILSEKEVFPRYKVGESLLPSALTIFDILGIRDEIEKHGFVKKRGAYLRWGKSSEPWSITFGELLGESGYSYHVIRSEFDTILLNHSQSLGVNVQQGTSIKEIQFNEERPIKAILQKGKDLIEVSFKYIVDCSGSAGILSNKYLNLRVFHDSFRNVALWSYWKDAGKLPAPYQGAVLTSAVNNGWIWGIPLHDGTQSIGVVIHQKEFKKLNYDFSPEEIYIESLMKCSLATSLIANSTGRSEVKVITDYSYTSKRFAGPGYFICGDSACFLDPVLSSGVHLAMYSGLVAASAMSSILKGETNEEDAQSFFEKSYRRSFTRFAQFLSAFYNQNTDSEGYFWKAQKLTSKDFSSSDMKSAFLNLISGISDLSDVNLNEAVHNKMVEAVHQNLEYRQSGVSVKNCNSKSKENVLSNANLFGQIENLVGLNPSESINGWYIRVTPSLGLSKNRIPISNAKVNNE